MENNMLMTYILAPRASGCFKRFFVGQVPHPVHGMQMDFAHVKEMSWQISIFFQGSSPPRASHWDVNILYSLFFWKMYEKKNKWFLFGKTWLVHHDALEKNGRSCHIVGWHSQCKTDACFPWLLRSCFLQQYILKIYTMSVLQETWLDSNPLIFMVRRKRYV